MSWQSQEKGAFQVSDFQIDWDAQTVTCPQGKKSHHWKPEHGPSDKPTIQVQFAKADCLTCPIRVQCTRSTRGLRELTLHPRTAHLALQAARVRQATPVNLLGRMEQGRNNGTSPAVYPTISPLLAVFLQFSLLAN